MAQPVGTFKYSSCYRQSGFEDLSKGGGMRDFEGLRFPPMILIGAPLNDVLASIALLIEASVGYWRGALRVRLSSERSPSGSINRPGSVCSQQIECQSMTPACQLLKGDSGIDQF